MGVIAFLFIALLFVKDLFFKNEDNPQVLKVLVVIETFGITLLLLPTGGIDSPFIWYALNPVLIAASYISGIFCWCLLVFYMSTSFVLTYSFFIEPSIRLADLIYQFSYLFLVFVLITTVFQLFSNLTKELHHKAVILEKQSEQLQEVNRELVATNKKSNEAMEHIMSLYQTIESFTAQYNLNTLINTVLDFTTKLTKTSTSFCWLLDEQKGSPIFSCSNRDVSEIMYYFEKEYSNINNIKSAISFELSGNKYYAVPIQSTNYYGFLGIAIQVELTSSDKRLLKFLADLSSVILERFYLKEALDHFLIVEEQNRIANEIHDSVSQRLFGIVYGLHFLRNTLEKKGFMESDEIQILSDSANLAMKELRSSIYQLSTKKKGESFLFSMIEEFLYDLEQLYKIEIKLNLYGGRGTNSVFA